MKMMLRHAMVGAMLAACGGCTTFDPLDQRGETINRNATDYANNAELLNVVRASLSEPLTFVTITGLDGTDSATGTLGLPGITFGPRGTSTSPRDFLFGPNSVGRSNSNTFHVSVVDDPGSFAALLAPVNPALTGFFLRQGYPADVLFFLFVDRIREVEYENGKVTAINRDVVSDPLDGKKFHEFLDELSNLLAAGLTAQVDTISEPTGHSITPSKLCIDPNGPLPSFADPPGPGVIALRAAQSSIACETTAWIATQTTTSPASSGSSSSGNGGGSAANMVVGPDNSLWVNLGSQNAIVRISLDATGKLKMSDQATLPVNPTSLPKQIPIVAYPVDAVSMKTGKRGVHTFTPKHYQIFMRSTYGIYNFLGTLLHERALNHKDFDIASFPEDESGYRGLLDIVSDNQDGYATAAKDCFAKIDYRKLAYCVPNGSNRTKRIFALLHQLQELNTAPSNNPTTLTVTSVP